MKNKVFWGIYGYRKINRYELWGVSGLFGPGDGLFKGVKSL